MIHWRLHAVLIFRPEPALSPALAIRDAIRGNRKQYCLEFPLVFIPSPLQWSPIYRNHKHAMLLSVAIDFFPFFPFSVGNRRLVICALRDLRATMPRTTTTMTRWAPQPMASHHRQATFRPRLRGGGACKWTTSTATLKLRCAASLFLGFCRLVVVLLLFWLFSAIACHCMHVFSKWAIKRGSNGYRTYRGTWEVHKMKPPWTSVKVVFSFSFCANVLLALS